MTRDAADNAANPGYAGDLGVAPEVAKHAVLHGFTHREAIARDNMLSDLQRESFGYFLHEVNEANGLVSDKTSRDWPASIAAVGMALTAYPVCVQRALMTHAQALQRTLLTLRALSSYEQSESPTASGWRGFFYHFLDMETGRRAWECELSTIDTALLMAGVLTGAAWPPPSTNASSGTGWSASRARSATAGSPRPASCRGTGKATTRRWCCTCWRSARPRTASRRRPTTPGAPATSGRR